MIIDANEGEQELTNDEGFELPGLPDEVELREDEDVTELAEEESTKEEVVELADETENEQELEFEVPEEIEEDKIWDKLEVCGIIETIVFMSDKPVALTKIRSVIDEKLTLEFLYECISDIQKKYDDPMHGIRLMEVGEGFQFRTKAQFSKYVQSYFKVTSLVLSPSCLEVLAFIAYKQPVSKIELEKIRGVDSSHLVRLLIDKRLVKVVGRSEEVGRPTLYGTTNEFLEVFNLRNLDELPPEYELEALASKNEIGSISDIKSFISDNNPWRNQETDLGELDELASSIKNVNVDTEFTKTLKSLKNSENSEQKKSAFDVLEEFLERNEIVEQNLLASQSELLTTVVDAKVKGEEEDGDLYEEAEGLEEDREKLAEELDKVLDTWEDSQEDLDEDQALLDDVDRAFENLEQTTEKMRLEMDEDELNEEIKPLNNAEIDEFFKEQ